MSMEEKGPVQEAEEMAPSKFKSLVEHVNGHEG